MISEKEILDMFLKSRALLTGHFQLSSGLHSEKYLQCALVLKNPATAAILGAALAEKFKHMSIDTVASPALGGLIIGHEVARAIGVDFIFTERENGAMTLRRGFEVKKGGKILVIEDVLTTGGSTLEVIAALEEKGAIAAAAGAIVNRSGKEVALSCPFQSLLKLDIRTYSPEDCPLCKAGDPLKKPGSRTAAGK